MEEIYKSGYLFGSLIQHINDPFLVLDFRGKILSFNESASELLSLGDQIGDIFSYIDETSVDELNIVLSKKLTSKVPISISIRLKLQSGLHNDATIFLNSSDEKGDEYIFCRIKTDESIIATDRKTGIKIKVDNFADIINNKKIISIIEEIKTQYPFTFIGKERIQKLINGLDEIIWLQDVEGSYQLLNDKLAKSLGVSIPQVEGKPLSSFLPVHLVDFQNSLTSYIKRSLNYIVIEGIPLNNFSPNANFQTIEIPLSDIDNNVLAIIGITQAISRLSYKITDSDILNATDNLLQFCPKPIALVNKNEIIKQATKEFCKLFEQEYDDLRESNIKSVLPEDIIAKIEQFVLSSSFNGKFEFFSQGKFKKKYTDKIVLLLNKIYNDKLEFQGFSIFVENSEENFDPKNLFLREGKMYELLVDNNPEPIFIYDTENLSFLEVNKAALDLYGYRKDEFLQLDLTDLYSTEDIQSLLDNSKKKNDKETFSGPYKHKRKDGSIVFVELSKSSFKFDNKDANFIVIRNVSEKLELEKKNKSFDAIFDNSDNLIFVTDTGGFIAFVNDTACRILGHSKDDFKDTSFATYLIDEERGNFNASVFKEKSKDVLTLNVHLKIKDGHPIESEVMAIPILNYKNEIESFTLIVKKRIEPIVGTGNGIKEVTIEKPEETSPSAGTAAKIGPSFLSELFHEILTPLNVILGFVREFTDSINNLTPEQKETAEIINQNREKLLKTMNSVVEYSNIQKNNVDFDISEVTITEIIDTLQNNIKELTSPKDIEFAYGKISSSLKFRTDKEKFQNLLNTLVKLVSGITREKKIYLSAYPESEDRVIISIKDNYTHPTKNLLEFYKDIFIKGKYDIKEYGLSKLRLRIAAALLNALSGKAEVSGREGNEDLFFVFPLDFKRREEPKNIEEEEQTEEIERAIEELKGESKVERNVVEEKYSEFNDELSELEAETEKLKVDDETRKIQPEPIEEESKEAKSESEAQLESEPTSNEAEKEKLEENIVEGELTTMDLSQLRCLYIEDQVDSQILFKVQMKELKEIKFAISFEEAIPVLDSDTFDFIVIDINLQGDYNGLDALKVIQKMPGYKDTPIIAVTAYVLPGDKEKFIAAGFSEFISKPIFKEKMLSVLANILSEKK